MLRVIKAVQSRWVIGENVRGFVNEPLGLQRSLSDLESIGYKVVTFLLPACATGAWHRRDRVWVIGHKDVADAQCKRQQTSKHERRSRLEKRVSARSCEDVGNAQYDGFSASEGRGRLLDKSEEQRRKKEVRKSKGASGSSRDVADAQCKRLQGGEKPGSDQKQWPKSADKQFERSRWSDKPRRKGEAGWLPEPDVGRVAHGVPNRVDRLKALGNAVVPQVVEQIGKAIIEAER